MKRFVKKFVKKSATRPAKKIDSALELPRESQNPGRVRRSSATLDSRHAQSRCGLSHG